MHAKATESHITCSVPYLGQINSVTESDRARFRAKVDRRGDHECWPFTGRIQPNGYGMFRQGRHGNRPSYAHRTAWEFTYGEIPEGLLVCHRCDERNCCNPAHLFLGTQLDNLRDASAKGRLNIPRKRNRDAKPEAIARYLAGGVTQQELADEYGVNKLTICRWLKGLKQPYARPKAS